MKTSRWMAVAFVTLMLGCSSQSPPTTAPVASSSSAPSSSASTQPANSAADFSGAMMQSMAKMDRDMSAAPMTGDPDHDFAAMMIPHHQGAIDMAEPYLLYGKDPVLRRLAQEIIITQQQEIEVMRRRLVALAADPPGASPQDAPPAAQNASPTAAQNALPASLAVSSHDRVYTADQTSNTVSVIDPAANKLLGIIRLGDPAPAALSPLYRGQLLVHGIGFSPDHKTIAVISIASNSVTFIDTASNTIKGVVYIGRSPHEAFFTPDGSQLWVAVRGENYVSVIDPVKMTEIRRITTANGPGMILFRPDGRYAYVPSSFTPELDVIDLQTDQVIARVPQASPFSPNLAVTADGQEVWFTLKDSGKTQVMNAAPPFNIITTIDTGPITNHVTTIENANGSFAYVTVGGENAVKVFQRGNPPKLVATIPTGDLPHGIWGSGDGSRVYVGLENQDQVIGIDTLSNKIIATIPIGQQPQALVYVPNAVPEGDGTANLIPLADAGAAAHLEMIAPQDSGGAAKASISVNQLGALDLLQLAATGLQPGHTYTLWLVASRMAPFGDKQALVNFKANAAGAQIAQTIGPLRQILTSSNAAAASQRYLLVTESSSDTPVLVQSESSPK